MDIWTSSLAGSWALLFFRGKPTCVCIYIYIYICIIIIIIISLYIYIYILFFNISLSPSLSLSIYIYIYIGNPTTTRAESDDDRTIQNQSFAPAYGQFSKFQVCFCGLDPGNLKFETVRTNKHHICF